jgi:hypothetical protein
MGRLGLGAAILAAVLAFANVAAADDPPAPAPDKSGFTVFDPTPVADERGFCTDRPTKSTGACTVDAGHLQYESDLVNFTYDRSGGVTTQTWLYTNPTLKLGLTNTLDVEVNVAPWETITTTDRASGAKTQVSGVGDLYFKAKLSLIGDDGGDVAVALAPYIKVPTARPGIGNGAVEGGLIVPLVFNLPQGWQLTVDPEADVLANEAGGGEHANLAGLLCFSHPVSKTLTASAEVWTDANLDPTGTVRQYSADLGLAWVPASHPNIQLDGGVNIGLNSQTPAAQVYLGLSQRF